MATTQYDISAYLKEAKELSEKVAKVSDKIDHDRQIPTDLADEMADKGFFRLLLPESLGGAELKHPDFLQILEIFANVDGSTAWCVNQNNVFSTNSLRMPEDIAKEIWGEQRAVVTNGPPTSLSQAIPVDGGYRLSGRWHFSSGMDHATWIAAMAPISDGAGSKDASRDRTGARIMLIPKDQVTFLDLWQVNGLRGTASFSYEIEDLFVPMEHTYDPTWTPRNITGVYAIPTTLLFATGFSTVALGVARSSLDSAISLAGEKVPGRSSSLLQSEPSTHRVIGEAEAIWKSSKAYLGQSASAVWESAYKKQYLTTEERINLRLATTHGIRMAAQIVDMTYNLCGTDAIFELNPIQRKFQDVHVMTQHTQGRFSNYETAGQFFLGLEPSGNF